MTFEAPAVVPLFGITPHTPEKCVVAKIRVKKGLPCPTCGRGPRPGSSLVCMDCHRGSPGMERAAARHVLPSYATDRRKEPKDSAPAKKPVRLTAKQRKSLLADARKGEHNLPLVEAFLASQDQAHDGPV